MSRFGELGARTGVSAASAAVLPLAAAPSDAELVARALGGDRWAEEALYKRHVHRVTGVAAKLLRNGPDVEDVVQDTFVEALEQLDKVRDPERIGRWLVGIAVHKAHRRFRRRKLMRALGLDRTIDDERLTTQIGREAGHDVYVEVSRIDAALDAMSADDRAVFVLRHLEGYVLEEVATIARCSLATVKRRLARAEAIVARVTAEEDHV